MPEPASYPGSPSLSAEAREKVLQTFRHTLEMARAGRNEDALLGCDFILKMDARFTPARRLLASLRGIAAGTVVDLGEFDVFGPAPARPAPPPAAPPAAPVSPTTPAAGYAAPPVPAADPFASPGSGLDSLGFDDLGPNPFAPAETAAPPRPAEAAPAFSAPSDFGFGTPAPASDSFSAAPDPYAAPSPFAAPAPPPDAYAPPPAESFLSPAAASFPAAGAFPGPAPAASDPRIVQFLKQGDDAASRGNLQEAIDLWSRVFLIDLSNEDASRRIDATREKQNETARSLDVFLSEGVQLYEAGDLQSARNTFLKVLTISESDATARNYLNQIDAALASAPSASASAAVQAPSPAGEPAEPYLRDELESPGRPSFAEDLPTYDERASAPSGLEEVPVGPARRETATPDRAGKIDGRVLLGLAALVLVGVAAAAYFVFKPKPAAPPTTPGGPVAASPEQDPLESAQALFRQGKVEEALGILTAIPAGDPRHDQALILIDQFKSSAEPRPSSAPAVSAAALDEARLAGLASLASGRYIDAVKSLDLVVRARPDDTEAAQALSRARDSVSALGSAIRSYNEQDYESAQRLLWDLRKQDPNNQDVEEYLFKSYFNDGILSLQSGSTKKAVEAFKEATALRPQDVEAQRHLKFARRYSGGSDDLLARIYVKHVSPRP
jgi:tetratricopeptide (TPR) repeat protein